MLDRSRLSPGVTFGERYRLERRLGSGGMASIWLATDERLGRRVAVKILSDTLADDAEFMKRFHREATLAGGLQHPNLVGVYDFCAEERPYLVMEYVPCGDLRQRLANGGRPDPERLARELLDALAHIHAAGILHRDVKPHNILLDRDGRARLTDFGIAQSRGATALTKTGHVLGTESYLAPELLAGEPASERSDLYALGVVLAEAARKAGAPARVWTLIDELRATEPAERPASAREALRRLDAAPADAPAPDGHDTEQVEAVVTARRGLREHLGALAAVGLVAVIGTAAVLAFDGGREERGSGGAADGKQRAAKDRERADRDAGREDRGPGTTPVAVKEPGLDGHALNDEGKALIDAGSPVAAVPLLERAVELLRDSGDELTYNYALFNLGNALRLAGRPQDAIPILEERLRYPDQRETVARELEAARREVGLESGGMRAKGRGDEDGGVGPPPWANDDD